MKWNKETKDKISYIVASLAFLFGIGLTIAGFIVHPLGIVDDSVLWVLGQCLVFSGGVFGVGLYINNKMQEVKADILKSLKSKKDIADSE